MAIVGDIVVESRRYSGWTDPRYPIGYWQAALSVTGDATGGTLGISLIFQSAIAGALNSQMYSVERLAATASSGLARNARVKAVNMGGPSNLGFSHEYVFVMLPQGHASQTAIGGDQFSIIPWFLGSQRQPNITASLSIIHTNDNGVVFSFEAEGYRWSPRSVLVDGGPQRPPTGLYRA